MERLPGISLLLPVLLTAACNIDSEERGPAGPQGIQGPPGPAGMQNVIVFSTASGIVWGDLDLAANTEFIGIDDAGYCWTEFHELQAGDIALVNVASKIAVSNSSTERFVMEFDAIAQSDSGNVINAIPPTASTVLRRVSGFQSLTRTRMPTSFCSACARHRRRSCAAWNIRNATGRRETALVSESSKKARGMKYPNVPRTRCGDEKKFHRYEEGTFQ